MILYEGPLALSPSHLEMFTLLCVHVRVTKMHYCWWCLCALMHAALFLIMLCARSIIKNNAVCRLHYF
jgi:hypothetical protein